MKPIHVIAACAVVLALTYGPVNAQDATTMMNGGDKEDKDDDTWKRIAIILPIVFGGISMLILLWYCCCRAPHGGGWGCGECHCGSCCGGAYGDYPGCRCHNGECCGCQCGQCMGPGGQCCGDCCGAAPNGQCCPGCDMCCRGGACGVDCCRGCGGCGCDGCCPGGVQAGNQVYYSSSRGPVYASQPRPVVQVEDAYVYRSQPPADSSPYGGYTSNIGVNGAGGPYNPVYGGFRQGGYAGPASGGGCGCR